MRNRCSLTSKTPKLKGVVGGAPSDVRMIREPAPLAEPKLGRISALERFSLPQSSSDTHLPFRFKQDNAQISAFDEKHTKGIVPFGGSKSFAYQSTQVLTDCGLKFTF